MNKDEIPAPDPATTTTTTDADKSPAPPAAADERDAPLRVTLVLGDVTQVETQVVVAGQYKGVAPLRSVGLLDAALDFWISEAASRSMIGGDLGELFFVPVFDNTRIKARTVLLAGMGDFGKFSYEALCYLTMNVAYAVSNLGVEKFASVLIGWGAGALPLDAVVKGMLSGICDGLHHLPREKRALRELVFVDADAERHEQILALLRKFAEEQTIGRLALTVEEGAPLPQRPEEAEDAVAAGGARAAARPKQPPGSYFVNRINVERSAEGFLYSALTDTAVVPVRAQPVQESIIESIINRLQLTSGGDQEEVGRLLHQYVFPDDFDELIVNRRSEDAPPRALTLVLDRASVPLPWEMACFIPPDESEDTTERIYFGIDLRLTRQFRTQISRAPRIAPPVNRSLRVLVIADPAREKELQLEGARAEGEALVKLLRESALELKESGELDLQVVSRIGYAECDPVDILRLVYYKTFDVIHFSGHGVFDAEQPNHGGWVFSADYVLSALEIFRTRRVPRLVFANACFSAATKGRVKLKGKAAAGREEFSPEATNRKLAGLAEAFFERGVQNYIGTGWKVNDAAATLFATTFYSKALAGYLIGDALAAARREIFDYGPTWGAYQHYGQSNARLTSRWPRGSVVE